MGAKTLVNALADTLGETRHWVKWRPRDWSKQYLIR